MVAPISQQPGVVESAPALPRFGVEIQGRLYPRRLRTKSDPPLLAVERERNAKIATRLRESLPWFDREPSDFARAEDMVRSYEDGLRLLSLRHQEVAELIRETCICGFEVEVTTSGTTKNKEEVVKKIQEKRIAEAGLGAFKPDQVLTATLLAKPKEVVYARLSESLEQACHRVVQATFDALDRLVDKSVVGLMQWTGPTFCLFHYFSESSKYHASLVRDVASSFDMKDDDDELYVRTTTTEKRDEVERRFRRRHEHHLMEAEPHLLPASNVVVPVSVQPVIDKIPAWLRPEARVVTGTQFRNDVLEQQLKDRVWLKEHIIHREIRLHHDPAVVIDRFVLTGWGEQETRAELERRDAETERNDRTEFVSQHEWTEKVTRWTAGLGIGAYLLSQFGSVAFFLLALLLLAVSAWHTWLWLENAVRYYRPAESWQVYACGLTGRVLRWVAILTFIKGLIDMAWPVALTGAVLGGVSTLLLQRTNSVLGVPVFTTKI